MFATGDLVRIRPAGVSEFEVVEVLDDTHATILATGEAPGRYPFSMRVADLIPAAEA